MIQDDELDYSFEMDEREAVSHAHPFAYGK
jgi:hypothetical protein